MVKILHTADIHLDSPFSLLDVKKAQARKAELRGTFSSMMLYAKSEKYDIVLMAGDLFDSEFATKETLEMMATQFASAPECRFVISPGNHDPLTPKSPYRKVEFPSNVYIFSTDDIGKFSFDDIGVDVYGWAFTEQNKPDNPLRLGKVVLDKNKLNILCVHADTTAADSPYCPINESDIASSGFDYVALGHVHAGGEVRRAGSTYYAYSGCLEGRSFDECGQKGVIVVKAESSAMGKELKFGFKRFSHRRFEKVKLDVSGVSGTEGVIEKMRAMISQEGLGDDTMLRVSLRGVVSPSARIDTDRLTAESLGLFYLEVKNDTLPLLGEAELMNDISIRGAFFRELLPKLKSDDENERRVAAAALRYGLAALEGEEPKI